MKKTFLCVAALFAAAVVAGAQHVSTHFGLLGGVTTNSFIKIDDLSYKPLAGWTAGAALMVKMPAYFSIQPSLMYEDANLLIANPADLSVNYKVRQHMLSIPVPIQWGPDLGLLRPFLQVVPALSFGIGRQNTGAPDDMWNDIRQTLARGEFSLGVGGGFEIWKLQISVRYSWCLGDWSQMTRENPFRDIRSRRKGLSATIGIFF